MRLKDILEQLSEKEKDEIRSVINYLEKHSFLMEKRLNTKTLMSEPVPQHELCLKHEDFISDYFELRGAILVRTNSEATFYLTGEKMSPFTPSEELIRFLIIVRQLYGELSSKLNARDICFTKKTFRECGDASKLFPEKISEKTWNESLSFMKKHNLITFPGNVSDIGDEDNIYIYSTIAIYITPKMIAEAVKILLAKESEEEIREESEKEEVAE